MKTAVANDDFPDWWNYTALTGNTANYNVSSTITYTCGHCGQPFNGAYHTCRNTEVCKWCEVNDHTTSNCPRIESVEYHKDGTISRMIFRKL